MAMLGDVLEVLSPKCEWSVVYDASGTSHLTWLSDLSLCPSDEAIKIETDKQTLNLPYKILRQTRNELLQRCDIYGLQDFPEGETKEAWKSYRQELRDIPKNYIPFDNSGNVIDVIYPTPPS